MHGGKGRYRKRERERRRRRRTRVGGRGMRRGMKEMRRERNMQNVYHRTTVNLRETPLGVESY